MKKLTGTFFCIIAIILILSFPKIITESVKDGIILCLYNVLPALLPFMLIVNIMQKYDYCRYISYITKPFLNKLFHITDNGCFAVIIGFSCGYPMGAKVISDLHSQGKITLSEARYLATFCNNCSISFLINYIYFNFVKNLWNTFFSTPYTTIIILFLVYAPAVLTGIINRFWNKTYINSSHLSPVLYSGNPILSSVKSLSILCVYVICFTIFSGLIASTSINTEFKALICGFLEITSGAPIITASISHPVICIYFLLLCTVFGGFSITMQSLGQLKNKTLKKYYILGKIESIIIFSVLFIIVLYLNNKF